MRKFLLAFGATSIALNVFGYYVFRGLPPLYGRAQLGLIVVGTVACAVSIVASGSLMTSGTGRKGAGK